MATLHSLPDDLLLRITAQLPTSALAALGASLWRVAILAPVYVCAACSHPLFPADALTDAAPPGYFAPTPVSLCDSTRPMRARCTAHRSEPKRLVCNHCGAFVALIPDGTAIPLVYLADVRRVPSMASEDISHRDFHGSCRTSQTSLKPAVPPNADQAVLCRCGCMLASFESFRQRLRWIGAGFTTRAIALTSVHRSSVLERGKRGMVTACLAGEIFCLNVLECIACSGHLGWRVVDIVVEDTDDFGEKCPIAPELVGRFIIVEDALAPPRVRPLPSVVEPVNKIPVAQHVLVLDSDRPCRFA